MARTIPGETKRGKPKKGQKTHNLKGSKRRRKLVFLMVGSCFIHVPFYVISMQIVRSTSNVRSRTNITCQRNFPFYSKG